MELAVFEFDQTGADVTLAPEAEQGFERARVREDQGTKTMPWAPQFLRGPGQHPRIARGVFI
jgi:hypothetical protein